MSLACISEHYTQKSWCQRELEFASRRESVESRDVVLPIAIGDPACIARSYPMLKLRHYLTLDFDTIRMNAARIRLLVRGEAIFPIDLPIVGLAATKTFFPQMFLDKCFDLSHREFYAVDFVLQETRASSK